MKLLTHICITSILLTSVEAIEAGTLQGTVKAEVRSQSDSGSNGGNYGSRKYKFLEKVDYSNFKDFVLSLEAEKPIPPAGKTAKAKVTQKNGMFIPRVLPVATGTEVEWPNEDDIFHNVFSISDTRPFDLGYYKKEDDAKVVVFDKQGRVDVFCSIHSKMNCIVLVMPNNLFSSTDKRGRYEIKNIPAGTYRLKAWHERLPSKYQEISIPESGVVEVDIVMGLADLPKI